MGHILAALGVLRLRAVTVPGALVFMSEKIVSICENEGLRSATVKAVDALDREIDAVWGLIAIIEVLDQKATTTIMQAALCASLIII